MPLWARGFVNVIQTFREGHEIDKMIVTNISDEASATKNSGQKQSSSISGALVLFLKTFRALIYRQIKKIPKVDLFSRTFFVFLKIVGHFIYLNFREFFLVLLG